MEKEFTASVYLIDKQKILLLFHPKLAKWLPPGGHVEPNETPVEAARREVQEETGLLFEFLPQENLWMKYFNAQSIERPYLCLLEEIPAYKNKPAHQHVDFVFIGRPTGHATSPTHDYRWFTWEELKLLKPDEEIFSETLHVIQHLLESQRSD